MTNEKESPEEKDFRESVRDIVDEKFTQIREKKLKEARKDDKKK